MKERRSEPRYMCADLVMVRILDPDSPVADAIANLSVANLEDISPSGACVQMESAVREGADIEILCAACRFQGSVKYCRFVEIGYDVGVEFRPRASWRRERYEPQHLLILPVERVGGGGET